MQIPSMKSLTRNVSFKNVVLAVISASFILSYFYTCSQRQERRRRNIFSVPRYPQSAFRPHPHYRKRVEPQSIPGIHHSIRQDNIHDSATPSPNQAHIGPDNLCRQRMGSGYVDNFIPTATNYCEEQSTAKLICFHSRISENTDSFCLGDRASFDADKNHFHLDCDLKPWPVDDTGSKVPLYNEVPHYWYGTGPRIIFSRYFNLGKRSATTRRVRHGNGPETWILVKRENNSQNIWHTLMEVMSLSMSLEILSRSEDRATGSALWSEAHLKNARIVFLDGLPEGPYYDLWLMFTALPSLRLEDLSTMRNSDARVILPLPGSSNPFWQGHWADMRCGESSLLIEFSHRVLNYYNIDKPASRSTRKLVITIAHRANHRRLVNQDVYVSELRSRHPNIKIQVVDFGTLDLAKQIEIAHNTDILAGAHGAGLTHAMFLAPNSTIVEILPQSTNIKTFDLVAESLGHRYFRRFGSDQYLSDDWTGDWQHDDIFLEQSQFLALMEEAIKSSVT